MRSTTWTGSYPSCCWATSNARRDLTGSLVRKQVIGSELAIPCSGVWRDDRDATSWPYKFSSPLWTDADPPTSSPSCERSQRRREVYAKCGRPALIVLLFFRLRVPQRVRKFHARTALKRNRLVGQCLAFTKGRFWNASCLGVGIGKPVAALKQRIALVTPLTNHGRS